LPKGLGVRSRGGRLWRAVTGVYELRADELAVLEDACRHANLVVKMEAEVGKCARGSLTVAGSKGQDAPHPLLAELRMSRHLIAQSLARLQLPDEPGIDRAARRSVSARSAARVRWSG
jgi:hypothetical protein